MKKIFLIVLFLVSVELVSAATIYGNVYDISLNRLNDVVVEIDTVPKQTNIAKNGSYSFDVPMGTYQIKAQQLRQGTILASSEDNISIATPGNFVLDLILFPNLDEETSLIDETVDVPEDILEEERSNIPYIIAIVIVLALAAIFFYVKKQKKHPKKIEEEKIEEKKEETKASKYDLQQIIEFIKKEGGRTTQKEIRKHLPLSEGKISLMITELEHEGKVKRVKKGRGNVIILQ